MHERAGRCYRLHYVGHDVRVYSGKFHERYGRYILSPVRFDDGYLDRFVCIERLDVESGSVRDVLEAARRRDMRRNRLRLPFPLFFQCPHTTLC